MNTHGSTTPSADRRLLWLAEVLCAGAWLVLLVMTFAQRRERLLPLLSLGAALAPLHVLRLRVPCVPRAWLYGSYALEIGVAAGYRGAPETATLLGVLLAYMTYAWWPRAERAPSAAGWGYGVGALLGLAALVGVALTPDPLLVLFPLPLLALEAYDARVADVDAFLARSTATLSLIASWSVWYAHPRVTVPLCMFVAEVWWLRRSQSAGDGVAGARLTAWRALTAGVYLQCVDQSLVLLAGVALCLFAVVSFLRGQRAPHPWPFVPVATLLLWAGEGLASVLGYAPPPPAELHAYLARYGDAELAIVDSSSTQLSLRGVDYRLDLLSCRWQGEVPAEQVGVVVVGDDALFGLGVEPEATVAEALEERLRELGRPTTVVTFAALGGNYETAFLLLQRAERLYPRAAVVWLISDDDLLEQRYQQVEHSDRRAALPFPSHLLAPLLDHTRVGALLSAPYDAALRWAGVRDTYYENVVEEHSAEALRFGSTLWPLFIWREDAGLPPVHTLVLPTPGNAERAAAQARLEAFCAAAGNEVIPADPLRSRLPASAWLPWAPELPGPEANRALARAIGDALVAERPEEPR